jgi:hypothetical protein
MRAGLAVLASFVVPVAGIVTGLHGRAGVPLLGGLGTGRRLRPAPGLACGLVPGRQRPEVLVRTPGSLVRKPGEPLGTVRRLGSLGHALTVAGRARA